MSRPWGRILLGVAIIYSLAHLGYSLVQYNPMTSPHLSGDFQRAFGDMLQWRRSGVFNWYEVLHPPLYSILLRPFADLEFASVVRVVYFSQFVWFALAVMLMARAASAVSRSSLGDYVLAILLTVNFQPFLETVAMHKVEGLELLLICLAIDLFRRKRDVLAGAMVVLGANLKYLPGVLALYFLVKRETRALAGMCVAAALCVAASTLAVSSSGWTAALQYPFMLMFGHQHGGNRAEASIEFQTLSGSVSRWFVDTGGMMTHFASPDFVQVSNPSLALGLAAILKAGCLVFYFWTVRRRWTVAQRQTHWPVMLCELSLTLVMIFIIAQASRVHYAILLLPAFVSAALLLRHYPDVLGWTERWLFAGAYSLTAFVIPGGLLNRLPPHPVWGSYHSFAYLWFSLPFFGMLLLACCLLRCRTRLLRYVAGAAPALMGAAEPEPALP